MLKLQGYKNLVMAAQGVFWTLYEGINTRTNARWWLLVFDEFINSDPALHDQIAAIVSETTRSKHPNILAPLTIEEHKDRLVLLYPPFNGQSVQDLITAQIPIVERKAASAVKQAASALQFARIRGVNHGLFCSEYLFLSRNNDDAQVLGFGFDRLFYGLHDRLHPNISRYLAYVPPEKFASQQQPQPDDVYALGLVSYEMLTGSLLFTNLSPADIRRQKQFPLPAPKQLNSKLSQHVSDLTMQLIDPNPARRANYNAVLDLLEPQNNNVPQQEEIADNAAFDFKPIKWAVGKIKLPVNLVGSKKRMVNILFSATVVFILLISVSLISRFSKSDEKRLQSAYKEFIAENQHTAESTAAVNFTPDPTNSIKGAIENPAFTSPKVAFEETVGSAPQTTAASSPKTETTPAVKSRRTFTFERPAFADHIRLDADPTPLPLPAQATLALGRHTVTFIDSNTQFTWQTELDFQETYPASVVIDPAQVGSGEVLVVLKNANDYGYVFVVIDDKNEQHATPFRTQLYAGRHRIRIYRESLTVSPSDTVVFIKPNEKTAIEATVF